MLLSSKHMKIQSYLLERIFSKWQLFTTHENSVLPLGEIFPNDNFLRKPAPFIGLDLEDTVHQTDQSAISTESTNQRSAPNQPISDQHRINQSAISIFPPLFDLWPYDFFFFFYSSPDSSHTLWWIVEYSDGETSTLCQLEVSVWPCVCSTGCSRLVTHPGTNPARRCLTSVILQEPVCHRHLVVDKNAQEW